MGLHPQDQTAFVEKCEAEDVDGSSPEGSKTISAEACVTAKVT